MDLPILVRVHDSDTGGPHRLSRIGNLKMFPDISRNVFFQQIHLEIVGQVRWVLYVFVLQCLK